MNVFPRAVLPRGLLAQPLPRQILTESSPLVPSLDPGPSLLSSVSELLAKQPNDMLLPPLPPLPAVHSPILSFFSYTVSILVRSFSPPVARLSGDATPELVLNCQGIRLASMGAPEIHWLPSYTTTLPLSFLASVYTFPGRGAVQPCCYFPDWTLTPSNRPACRGFPARTRRITGLLAFSGLSRAGLTLFSHGLHPQHPPPSWPYCLDIDAQPAPLEANCWISLFFPLRARPLAPSAQAYSLSRF